MKDKVCEYNFDLDELYIRIGEEVEVPQVIRLENNILFEFNDNEDIICIVLPNFSKMFKFAISYNDVFVFSDMKIVNDDLLITLLWHNRPITVKINISEM